MHDATPSKPLAPRASLARCCRPTPRPAATTALGALAALAALLTAAAPAHAQSADADRFRPQPAPRATPATGLAAGPSASLPPPPPAAPAAVVVGPAPTFILVRSPVLPTVQMFYPRAVVGFTAGYGMRTPESFDSPLAQGGAWSVTGGVQLLPWIEVDARYFGFFNERTAGAFDQRWLTHAGAAVVRLTLPTPIVQPFVLAGAGAYVSSFTASRTSAFSDQGSVTHTVYLGLPFGAGFDIQVTNRLVLGLEMMYHPLVGDRGPTAGPTGATNLLTASMAFRFIL